VAITLRLRKKLGRGEDRKPGPHEVSDIAGDDRAGACGLGGGTLHGVLEVGEGAIPSKRARNFGLAPETTRADI
jgi:hypothetical protein